MGNTQRQISEGILRTDLNELVHSLVRELAMVCRKMAIYGLHHPLSKKSIEQPFFQFGRFFAFKQHVTLNVRRGDLYILNIGLKDSIFNTQLLQYLQILDVSSIIFRPELSASDLLTFFDALVNRTTLYDPSYRLHEFLREKKVTSIEVDSEEGIKLFENGKLYRGEIAGDFSVRHLALDQMGRDLKRLSMLYNADAESLARQGIDFNPGVVQYLVPECIASINIDSFVKQLSVLHDAQSSDSFDSYNQLLSLLSMHPQHNEILSRVGDIAGEIPPVLQSSERTSESFASSQSGALSSIISHAFEQHMGFSSEEFSHAFARLLKTGRYDWALDVINDLLNRLSDNEATHRQVALNFLTSTVELLQPVQDDEVLRGLILKLSERLAGHTETFEYSELIRATAEHCIDAEDWQQLGQLCDSLTAQREQRGNVMVYTSLAVKKALDQLNRNHIIDKLIDTLVRGPVENIPNLKKALLAIGSEEVALSLSLIISHETRAVRQSALKILGALGDPALEVFSRMVADDAYFYRDEGRQELADAKWYVVRNTIFVLGLLGDERAVSSLRIRICDPDIRVRRELVTALEKIGGEQAVDLLGMMAEDNVDDIRNAALTAVGVAGNHLTAPIVVDVIQRFPNQVLRGVTVLGRLGGIESLEYLRKLLDDPEELTRVAAGKVSREEFRVAVIKALTNLGDESGLESIRKFHEGMSSTQKIFLKNSPLNKAISDALAKK